MEKYLYVNNQFLPTSLKDEWIRADMWDEENGVFVNEEVFREFPPTSNGKIRIVGPDKMPAWADAPEPTHDELVATAEQLRSSLISSANAYMSERQWPGKAAIGRLKGDELVKYNLWLDYLDALYEVDTSGASNIEWPQRPEA